jgi:hypothetical protein
MPIMLLVRAESTPPWRCRSRAPGELLVIRPRLVIWVSAAVVCSNRT